MSNETSTFTLLLDEAFNKAAWHGPNLLGSLRGLTLSALLHRPRKESHNIWELAVHCAYWKYAVRNHLEAGRRNTFPHEGSNFFRRDKGLLLSDWKKDVAMLKRQHAALRTIVMALDPRTYGRRALNSKHTVRRTVLGIAAHDLYHAGQISLLKRLTSTSGE